MGERIRQVVVQVGGLPWEVVLARHLRWRVGRADELLVWLSVLGKYLPVVVQRQVLEWFSAELESLFVRQSAAASGRISAFHARAVHTWKFGVLFPSGFVSGSQTSCVWVLPVEHRN